MESRVLDLLNISSSRLSTWILGKVQRTYILAEHVFVVENEGNSLLQLGKRAEELLK